MSDKRMANARPLNRTFSRKAIETAVYCSCACRSALRLSIEHSAERQLRHGQHLRGQNHDGELSIEHSAERQLRPGQARRAWQQARRPPLNRTFSRKAIETLRGRNGGRCRRGRLSIEHSAERQLRPSQRAEWRGGESFSLSIEHSAERQLRR